MTDPKYDTKIDNHTQSKKRFKCTQKNRTSRLFSFGFNFFQSQCKKSVFNLITKPQIHCSMNQYIDFEQSCSNLVK